LEVQTLARHSCSHYINVTISSAACLCEAFEYLSQHGKAILKQDDAKNETEPDMIDAAATISARGARRNELHSATLAGKGGLLIDFSSIDNGKLDAVVSDANAAQSPKAVDKPTASWDLLDCRSWLLDASRRIAYQWVEDRKKLEGPAAKNIPMGTVDDLEGRLVEHSISLCEYLETELHSRSKTAAASKKSYTPRVNDMSKLSIKWQHGHERGSGGAGGLGASGAKTAAPNGSSLMAGQILILLTAKKLAAILKDEVAADALHKELRGVMGQQSELKRQKHLAEASRQRLHQMKRKPYLHARIMS
jgi:hypothetical protein